MGSSLLNAFFQTCASPVPSFPQKKISFPPPLSSWLSYPIFFFFWFFFIKIQQFHARWYLSISWSLNSIKVFLFCFCFFLNSPFFFLKSKTNKQACDQNKKKLKRSVIKRRVGVVTLHLCNWKITMCVCCCGCFFHIIDAFVFFWFFDTITR